MRLAYPSKHLCMMAPLTSLSRMHSECPASPKMSGWHCFASPRYAALISACVASSSTCAVRGIRQLELQQAVIRLQVLQQACFPPEPLQLSHSALRRKCICSTQLSGPLQLRDYHDLSLKAHCADKQGADVRQVAHNSPPVQSERTTGRYEWLLSWVCGSVAEGSSPSGLANGNKCHAKMVIEGCDREQTYRYAA